ncbi:MAG: MauE/DoxX family redox-associated membrane protein [Pirellulaceae bacterium]
MIRKWLSFRTLSIALAMVLLVTAVLKLHLLLIDPFADIKTGTSLPLLWLAVFIEVGVVWIVFSNSTDEMIKWLSLTSLFCAMSVISILRVFSGQSTCGCAGVIEINPLKFFIFDCVCLGALFNNSALKSKSIGFLFNKIAANRLHFAGQMACFAISGCFLFVIYPMLDRIGFFSMLRNEQVFIKRIDLGTRSWSDVHKVEIEMQNFSNSSINIVGAKSTCSCISIANFPFSVPAKSTLVTTAVISPKKTGWFHQRIQFFTDSKHQFVAGADIFGMFRKDLK